MDCGSNGDERIGVLNGRSHAPVRRPAGPARRVRRRRSTRSHRAGPSAHGVTGAIATNAGARAQRVEVEHAAGSRSPAASESRRLPRRTAARTPPASRRRARARSPPRARPRARRRCRAAGRARRRRRGVHDPLDVAVLERVQSAPLPRATSATTARVARPRLHGDAQLGDADARAHAASRARFSATGARRPRPASASGVHELVEVVRRTEVERTRRAAPPRGSPSRPAARRREPRAVDRVDRRGRAPARRRCRTARPDAAWARRPSRPRPTTTRTSAGTSRERRAAARRRRRRRRRRPSPDPTSGRPRRRRRATAATSAAPQLAARTRPAIGGCVDRGHRPSSACGPPGPTGSARPRIRRSRHPRLVSTPRHLARLGANLTSPSEGAPCPSQPRSSTPRCSTPPRRRASPSRRSTSPPRRRSTRCCRASPRRAPTASSRSPPAAPTTSPATPSRPAPPARSRSRGSRTRSRRPTRSPSRCTPTTARSPRSTTSSTRSSRPPRTRSRRAATRSSSRTCGTARPCRSTRTSRSRSRSSPA